MVVRNAVSVASASCARPLTALVLLCRAQVESVDDMAGWTIRRRDAFNGFSILSVVYDQLEAYYRCVIDNIAVHSIAAGAAHSVVVTRGGSGWAFGSGSYGQIGQGSLVGMHKFEL
jgi:hypothetical protein